jgi:hypothetical protein
VALEVRGDGQQHVGPQADGVMVASMQTTSSSFLIASISLLMLVSWLNQSEPCQKMPLMLGILPSSSSSRGHRPTSSRLTLG